MVHTTTSKFRFDNLRGNFDEEVTFKGEVIGEWVGANYDNYELGRHETAGKYGYDFWIVKKVLRDIISQPPALCNAGGRFLTLKQKYKTQFSSRELSRPAAAALINSTTVLIMNQSAAASSIRTEKMGIPCPPPSGAPPEKMRLSM